MRIIAGEFRGRNLITPKGRDTRPTTDRVKESMFSSIISHLGGLDGAIVLDAFAGSGQLGLEALSRGAAHVTFCETDPAARKAIERNVATVRVEGGRFRITASDAFKACVRPLSGGYSLVMLDPPYAYGSSDVLGLVKQLDANGWLAEGALITYEHAAKPPFDAEIEAMEGFRLVMHKVFGDSAIDYIVKG